MSSRSREYNGKCRSKFDVRIYMVNTASETSEKKMDCSENSDGTLGTPLEEVNLAVYFTP